jgi:hypothetical protein
MTRGHLGGTLVALFLLLVLPLTAAAQVFSAADLAGEWLVSSVTTPTTPFTGDGVRTYRGTLTFSATGAASGMLGVDESAPPGVVLAAGGSLTVSDEGLVQGALALAGNETRTMVVPAARILADRHTIVGAVTITRSGTPESDTGLITLVRRPAESEVRVDDVVGDWRYHEITPSNLSLGGDAGWTRGTITFHPDGCSVADLVLSNGAVRAAPVPADLASFGCVDIRDGVVLQGTEANLDARVPAGAARDLILGSTRAPVTGFPGLVTLSRIAPGGGAAFAPRDLGGSWRVFLHRVESRLASGTWEIGRSVFAGDGRLRAATLEDVAGAATALTRGALAVAPDGTVTGTLATDGSGPARQYELRGTLHEARDLITGVVTATVGSSTHHGLVTLVREVTLFDFGQPAYTVSGGEAARITVLRRGDQELPVSVDYSGSVGPATAGHDVTASGTLSFGPGTGSLTFDVMTDDDGRRQGSRTARLSLGSPRGAGTLLGAHATATLTIMSAAVGGTVRLVAPPSGVAEGGLATLTVVRSGGTAGDVTVQWTTVDGTARTTAGDYTDAGATLTFAAGETTKQITVQTLADSVVEGDETFHVRLQNPVGLTLGTSSTVTVTILDAQPGLQLAEAAYTVSEAVATATIKVVRTGPATGVATVRYATSPATATPGADYRTVSGVLTFGSNVRTATFTVPILADALVESDETVLLTLSEPSAPVQLGPQRTATLTIVDDDLGGLFQLSAAAYSVAENAGSVLITVRRTGKGGPVEVGYVTGSGGGSPATPSVDYLSAQGTLTFGPNETTKTFSVRIINDSLDEPNETFLVQLQGAFLGTPSSATVTIVDDDVPGTLALRAATLTVAETAGVASVTVGRTGGAAGGVTVGYATADGSATAGSDYTARAGTLTFHAGEMTKTLAIAVTDDSVREGNETFTLSLSNPGGGAVLGALRAVTVTITDNETGPTVQFGAPAFSVVEDGGTATISVTRTGSTVAGQSVRVRSVPGGTAPSGDFLAVDRIVTFATGQTTATFPVTVNDNGLLDGDRTVMLALSDPAAPLSLGVPRVAVLTIRNDDALLQFATTALGVTEGATATLMVQRVGSTLGTATVRYATSDLSASAPGDYTGKAGLLTLAPGVSSVPLAIVTKADTVAESTETLRVTLSQPTGATLGAQNPATVSILDDDLVGTVQFEAATFSVVEGAAATIAVTRTGGAAGPLTVAYATSPASATGGTAPGPGVDYLTRTGTLTFAAGATRLTFMVPTVQDAVFEGPESVNLQLTIPPGSAAVLGSPSTASLTIVDDDQARFQFSAAAVTVAEGAGSVTLTVQRLGAIGGSDSVGYTVTGLTASGGADFDATGGTLLFAPGVASRPLTVPIVVDTINEASETFRVTLTAPSAGTVLSPANEATVTILDDDPAGAAQFAAASYSTIEGGAVTLTVTRTGGTAGPVTVAYATSNGSATAGADYTAASGVLTFAAGEATRSIVVQTTADAEVEGQHFFDVTLSAPTGELDLGPTPRARVWIIDAGQMLRFDQQNLTVVEGGTATITVTRTGVPAGTVSASVLLGGTAQPGTDYTDPGPITLVFPPGVTAQSVTIRTLPDTVVEPGGDTLRFELVNVTGAEIGAPGVAMLFIMDNERPDLAVTSVTGPFQAANGLPMVVTATVVNLSGAAAPASKLGVFLSASDATPGAGISLGALNTPAIAPLGSAVVTGAVAVPPGVAAGTYFLSVVADAPGVVVEEVDNNNGRTAAAQVTLVQFLPDLVVTGVPSPAGTLSGKLLSTPLHVRNAGPTASGPFRVGVFLSQDPAAGTGLLLAFRDMPSLPPGSGADVVLSLNVPNDLEQGQYYVAGVADLDGAVVESDETNNALTSAVTFAVTRDLTKLARVSATFMVQACGDPVISGGSVDLTGTFTVASQTGTTAQGTLDATGTVDGAAIRVRGPFSATVNPDDTVSLSLTFTATGAITATGQASLAGTIAQGLLQAAGSGTIQRMGVGVVCPLAVTLQATGTPAFFFSLLHFAQGGAFNGATTPSPTFPLPITAFSAALTALFDPTPASTGQVRFTGPVGSGVLGAFADERQDFPAGNFYETDTFPVPSRSLAGTWSVLYEGATKTFVVPEPEAEQRFVAMLPTVTLNAAQTHIVSVSWVYKNRLTGATVPAPLHADAIQVEIDPNGYKSPDFPRTVTSHTFPTPIPLAQAGTMYISYKDSLTGNFYVTVYTQ